MLRDTHTADDDYRFEAADYAAMMLATLLY